MEKKERARKQTPSKILIEERKENENSELFALLETLEDIRRRAESRPTYTSYYVNVKAHSE